MEYKCQKCGKQATVHYQMCQVKWNVVNDEIDLLSQELLSGEDSEYFCEECDY